MRAATRKPMWYHNRGLPVPAAVWEHRMKIVLKRERARKYRKPTFTQET